MGIVAFIDHYIGTHKQRQLSERLGRLPLLYHALSGGHLLPQLLGGLHPFPRGGTSPAMIKRLLDAGCPGFESFWAPLHTRTTPWLEWLERLRSPFKQGFDQRVKFLITEMFVRTSIDRKEVRSHSRENKGTLLPMLQKALGTEVKETSRILSPACPTIQFDPEVEELLRKLFDDGEEDGKAHEENRQKRGQETSGGEYQHTNKEDAPCKRTRLG
jgi:hypothetical protein